MLKTLGRYRVLHLTTNVPGPIAVSKLALAGARTTKIEPPQGDALEKGSPSWYEELHRGQTILKVDLKSPEGRESIEPLLAESQLFITSLRPKALQRLSLDWENLHLNHPKLSMICIQGYAGEREDEPTHDLILQAEAGLFDPPALPRTLIADLATAERAYSAALLALLESEQSGRGSRQVVALADAAEEFRQPLKHGLTGPDGPLGGGFPAYGVYRAQSGWVALAAIEAHFASRFQELFLTSPMDRAGLESLFLTRSAEEWAQIGRKNDIPLTALRG